MRGILPTHFGALIGIELLAAHKQQREIAEQVGISTSYMSEIVRGTRIPPLDTALAIGKALGIHEDVVCYVLGVLPPDVRGKDVTEEGVIRMFRAFRDELFSVRGL